MKLMTPMSLSLWPTDPQTHSTFQKAPHFEAFVIFFFFYNCYLFFVKLILERKSPSARFVRLEDFVVVFVRFEKNYTISFIEYIGSRSTLKLQTYIIVVVVIVLFYLEINKIKNSFYVDFFVSSGW